jgi:hypothetical protein
MLAGDVVSRSFSAPLFSSDEVVRGVTLLARKTEAKRNEGVERRSRVRKGGLRLAEFVIAEALTRR